MCGVPLQDVFPVKLAIGSWILFMMNNSAYRRKAEHTVDTEGWPAVMLDSIGLVRSLIGTVY